MMAAGSGPPRRVVPPWRSGRMKNPLKLGMLGMLGIGGLGGLTFADVSVGTIHNSPFPNQCNGHQ